MDVSTRFSRLFAQSVHAQPIKGARGKCAYTTTLEETCMCFWADINSVAAARGRNQVRSTANERCRGSVESSQGSSSASRKGHYLYKIFISISFLYRFSFIPYVPLL